MIRAVVFDMDGVLIDSEIVYLRHQAETLKKNYPWIKEEDLYPLVGMDNKEDKFFLAGLLGREPSDPAFLRELSSMYDALEVDYPSILRKEAKAAVEQACEAKAEAVAEAAPVAANTKAILFSRVTCPNCRVAEGLLSKAGVAYEKLIADEHIEDCRKYGVKGAPTLVITDGENHKAIYSVPEIKKYIASL